MANITRGLLLVLTCSALVGCSNRMLVDNVPPPSFSGPMIAPQASAKLPTLAPAPTPSRRQPQANPDGIPREWLPGVSNRDWNWIVIHHSATSSGSARTFDRMHKEKGWDELGYHFVIGNGTDSGNGQVEVGPRWSKQKWGAHAKTANNEYNDHGIGICLVGNFDIERPTPQQTSSLARLVGHLMRAYKIPPDRILGHRDTKPTECPGRNMNIAAIRRMATQVAESGADVDSTELAAFLDSVETQTPNNTASISGELLIDSALSEP